MTRQCIGTTKAGQLCKSPPLKGAATCLAHADEETRGSVGFGGPQDGGGRPRLPRATELQRQLVEAHAREVVRPYFRALGLDVEEDGTVRRLDRGAIVVGRDKNGGVHSSTVEDLNAQVAAVAEALLNRVYGRPRQALEHSGPEAGAIELDAADSGLDLSRLDEPELAQLQAMLSKARPAQEP